MREILMTNAVIAAAVAKRPPGYLQEFDQCVIRRDAEGAWVDADSPAWKAMRTKYAPARAAEAKAKLSVPRDQWPWRITLLAALASEKDKGVGDTASRLLGGNRTKRLLTRVLGRDCGCASAQARLNSMYSYAAAAKRS